MMRMILSVAAGLTVFFLGMHLAEKGLVKGSGERLRQALQMFTGNLLSAAITGTVVTAMVQSSSAVSVMVIGFVNGGVMSLYQGMGVILGANIGTTVTMHLLALHTDSLEWWLAGIGLFLMVIGWANRRQGLYYGGLTVFGFGLIFFGLTVLQNGVAPLRHEPVVLRWLLRFGYRPVLAILAGAGLTAVIQSSSAVSGVVLMLIRQGMITAPGAIGIILGANVGTCATALLAGVNTNQTARRLALFHLVFNLFGVILFIPFLDEFSRMVITLDPDPGRQIALAHTLFNLVTTVLIFPWMRTLERMLTPAV